MLLERVKSLLSNQPEQNHILDANHLKNEANIRGSNNFKYV